VLTTAAEIEHHEQRVYQPGYTPTEIRNNIQDMLRESDPDQQIVDFQKKDIPPQNRDEYTHRILTDLLRQRDQIDTDFHLPADSVGIHGQPLADPRTYEAEYHKRDRQYNRLNRSMYHVYAASAHVIHDNNFLSYCRPSLRNLPVTTAFKLTTLKGTLDDQPPYQTIQRPTTAQTQPIFSASRPSFADVVRPALKPRSAWMSEVPPLMTDTEADKLWHQSNDALFGVHSPTTTELKQKINQLQQLLQQPETRTNPIIAEDKGTSGKLSPWRHPIARTMKTNDEKRQQNVSSTTNKWEATITTQPQAVRPTSPQPPTYTLAPNIVRQSIPQNIAENKTRDQPGQSASRRTVFSRSADVQDIQKNIFATETTRFDQSELGDKKFSSHKITDTAKQKSLSGQKQAEEESQSDDSDTSGDGSNYHTECWPSIGDRRGNPKSDYDKHGNRRQKQPTPARRNRTQKQPSPTRPTSNEFGGGTFWNRPATQTGHI
jgi:hypothetical protein